LGAAIAGAGAATGAGAGSKFWATAAQHARRTAEKQQKKRFIRDVGSHLKRLALK
jgi:phytoene/squalene synthetase